MGTHTKMFKSSGYARIGDHEDELIHEHVPAVDEPAHEPEHAAPAHVAVAARQATPADEARARAALFCEVVSALEPGEDPLTHELLQEMKRGLQQAQSELHNTITLEQDEAALMDKLAVNDVLDAALATYHERVAHGCSEQQAATDKPVAMAAPERTPEPATGLESELMDLLGMAPAQPDIAPVATCPTPAAALLHRTKSEQEFDDFFTKGRGTQTTPSHSAF